MQASEIKIAAEYALREPPRPGVAFQHVRVIEKVRAGRWKVEWIDPNPGLVDYVKSANLIAPWKQRRALERDEQRHNTLARHSDAQWDGPDGSVTEAVNAVLETTGEDLSAWRDGILDHKPHALERVAQRAGVDVPTHPLGYRDRHGEYHLPFECALGLARAFAAAEPNTVLAHVEIEERRYETEMHEPGNSNLLRLVNRWRASWALMRQWAGHDAAIAAREREIKHLRELLSRTVWELRGPTVDPARVADRLARALKGG